MNYNFVYKNPDLVWTEKSLQSEYILFKLLYKI